MTRMLHSGLEPAPRGRLELNCSMGKPSTLRRRPKSQLEAWCTTIRPHGSLDCEPPSPEVLIRGFAALAVTRPTSGPCRHLVISFVDGCVPDLAAHTVRLGQEDTQARLLREPDSLFRIGESKLGFADFGVAGGKIRPEPLRQICDGLSLDARQGTVEIVPSGACLLLRCDYPAERRLSNQTPKRHVALATERKGYFGARLGACEVEARTQSNKR